MRRSWAGLLLACTSALGVIVASTALTVGQKHESSTGVLDEDPRIQYATRPTTDRVAKLREALTHAQQSLHRDARTGFLLPALEALDVPLESQLLVFSKTGVQRAYTGPHTPRAIYFNRSVAVAYVPSAPLIEIAAQDPQQGVIFYTLDQSVAAPVPVRQTSCLSCHVSAGTLNVPGVLARSHIVGGDGNVMPRVGSSDVDHATPHPDRWGGWFVTSDALSVGYTQRGHTGNITFDASGSTSNQVFVEWLNSAPETRGYLSPLSDIVSLLTFDHQMHAINLLTRLNWEARVDAASDRGRASDPSVHDLVNELAEYLSFVGEMPPSVPLTARDGFEQSLLARTPKDRQGRSLAQMELVNRLFRYPCSYMVYSDAFDGLPPNVKQAVYTRMIEILSAPIVRSRPGAVSAADRQATLEILRDTKPDFPRS